MNVMKSLNVCDQAVKGPVPVGSPGPTGIASEESKAVVAENGRMLDVQDKEVSMEVLCSISSYDQWVPLEVSGQLPRPRYKVLFAFFTAAFAFLWLYFLYDCADIMSVAILSAWSCCH